MNKMLIGFVCMFLVAMLITGCSNGSTGQVTQEDKPVITIGVSAVLTGDMSSLGQSVADSAKLAIATLPKDTKYDYRLVVEDDRLEGKTMISVMQKFITVDDVDAVVSFSSGMGNIVSPLADQNDILHCALASDPNVANGKNNFIHWTTPEAEVTKMISELKSRGMTNIGIIAMNQQGVMAMVNDMEARSADAGLVIHTQVFNPGEKDFKTMLLKLQEEDVDVIMFEVFSPELEIIAKQYKELGMTLPITGVESIEFTDQPELFEGVWYVQAADATSEFRNSYKETYDRDFKIGGPNAYDCVSLIVEAFETAGDGKTEPSIESVVTAFGNIKNFAGAVGPLTVDTKHFVQSEPVVRQVKDGKFITISEAAPIVTSSKQSTSKKTIKIGLSAPLTGEAASYGQNELAGATLAVKELNENDGINGRPVELIVEDDQCGSKSVSVFNKLITVDEVVGIVGPMCSAAAGPALPVARDSNTPVIIIGASAPGLVEIGDNIFRVYPSDTFQGVAGAEFMYNTLGIKKVAVLYVENDWGQGIQKVFKEKYESLGGEITYISGVLPTEKDYKTTLLKLQNSGAEGIYLPLYPNQAVPALKQLKELGIDLPVVSGDAFAAEEIYSSGYADDAMYTFGKTSNPEEFKSRINAMPGFEKLDSNALAPISYDGVMVLARAIEKAGTDKDDIKAALVETHYRGISQPLIEFTDRELTSVEFDYFVIKDGKPELYK